VTNPVDYGDGMNRTANVTSGRTLTRRPLASGWSPPATTRNDWSPPVSPPVKTSDLLNRERQPALVVETLTTIEDSDVDAVYELYLSNIEPLDKVAALEHLDTREHMVDCFQNPEVVKLLARVDGEIVGLAMVTNNLDLVVEISTEFWTKRYPKYAARNAIFFGMVIVVQPSDRGLTAFTKLYTAMWNVPAKVGGVFCFDVCGHNREIYDVDRLAAGIASMFERSTFGIVDQQTYYAAELPIPLAD
jgi:hypothetical protein